MLCEICSPSDFIKEIIIRQDLLGDIVRVLKTLSNLSSALELSQILLEIYAVVFEACSVSHFKQEAGIFNLDCRVRGKPDVILVGSLLKSRHQC